MNDDVKQQRTELYEEQLSALMDGELGEFEMRRLLAMLDEHDTPEAALQSRTLLARWERYHQIRAALRTEPMVASIVSRGAGSEGANGEGANGQFTGLALVDRINAAVAAEPAASVAASTPAAAASVTSRPVWAVRAGQTAIAATVALSAFLGMQVLIDSGDSVTSGQTGLLAERQAAPVSERQFAVDADAQQRLNDYIRSVSIPARTESQAAPYNVVLESSPLLRPVADRELMMMPEQTSAEAVTE